MPILDSNTPGQNSHLVEYDETGSAIVGVELVRNEDELHHFTYQGRLLPYIDGGGYPYASVYRKGQDVVSPGVMLRLPDERIYREGLLALPMYGLSQRIVTGASQNSELMSTIGVIKYKNLPDYDPDVGDLTHPQEYGLFAGYWGLLGYPAYKKHGSRNSYEDPSWGELFKKIDQLLVAGGGEKYFGNTTHLQVA